MHCSSSCLLKGDSALITATKSRLFEAIFDRYNEYYLLRRHFRSFSIHDIIAHSPRPAFYIMNHSSWWDGLLIYHWLRRRSHHQHYLMMDEQQMSRYRFFRRIGAFSVDKTSRRGILESLQYAVNLLKSGKAVWLFPQGDICHLDQRPLDFQSGAAYILQHCAEIPVIPVTMVYTMGLHQKPEASMVFGHPLEANWHELNKSSITHFLQTETQKQLDWHKSLTVKHLDAASLPQFKALLKPRRSTNETMDIWNRKVKK